MHATDTKTVRTHGSVPRAELKSVKQKTLHLKAGTCSKEHPLVEMKKGGLRAQVWNTIRSIITFAFSEGLYSAFCFTSRQSPMCKGETMKASCKKRVKPAPLAFSLRLLAYRFGLSAPAQPSPTPNLFHTHTHTNTSISPADASQQQIGGYAPIRKISHLAQSLTSS